MFSYSKAIFIAMLMLVGLNSLASTLDGKRLNNGNGTDKSDDKPGGNDRIGGDGGPHK